MAASNLDRLVFLMLKTGRLVREGLGPRERINPFSVLKLETMHYVAKHHNPSMNDVAKYLAVTPPSTTSLIKDPHKVIHWFDQ